MKPRDREGPIQVAIVNYLRQSLPSECIVHHAKTEINRGGASFMREAAKAKRMGALAGFPDLVVLPFVNTGPAIFLEVKAEGNYATKSQKEMHASLKALGYRVAVVRSIDDVREVFREWSVYLMEV